MMGQVTKHLTRDDEGGTGQRQEHEKAGRQAGNMDRATVSPPQTIFSVLGVISPLIPLLLHAQPTLPRDDSDSPGSVRCPKTPPSRGNKNSAPQEAIQVYTPREVTKSFSPRSLDSEAIFKAPPLSLPLPHLSVSSGGTYNTRGCTT